MQLHILFVTGLAVTTGVELKIRNAFSNGDGLNVHYVSPKFLDGRR